jgi:exosortase
MSKPRLSPIPAPRCFAAAGGWLPIVALILVWLPLMARWSVAWSASADQAYGWAVPALALYLVLERWRTRPAPRPLGRRGRAIAGCSLAAGLVALAAALPVLEANALWPAAQWAGAAGALAVTFAGAAFRGGPGWAKLFAFPFAFVLTGLMWPTQVNLWIVTTLAGLNAQVAAEIVSAAGHPAVVNGNVIAVAGGLVGIDEACAGLRSLQAVSMIGFFFGEFFMLNAARRSILVAAALAVALAGNLSRTSFLTWQVAAHGIAAGKSWHDPAGIFELIATLAVTTALAVGLAHGGRARVASSPAQSASVKPPGRPGLWPWVALLGAVFAAGGTQIWYLAHEWRAPPGLGWELTVPDSAWQPIAVPAQAQAVLGNSDAAGLAWQDAATGMRAWAFLISWRGDAAHGENPEWHDPTVCLPASGARLVRNLGSIDLAIDGVPLTFSAYRFAVAGRFIDTFFCHWDGELDQSRSEGGPGRGIRWRRLQRVAEGRRRGDVAHLTLEIEADDDDAAKAWFRSWAPRLLHPTPLRRG